MHKKNNFDFLRLIFASFVIISHSYPLSGSSEYDWLYQITNGQFVFSDIGVKGFFIISGFLIFQSFERSNSILDFYWKRILRIFPGLIVVLILTVAFAPIIYKNSSVSFWNNHSVWTYIPNNLLLYRLQYSIPGIFETNPYKSAINGSLWTIPFEFTMYLLLSLFFFIKRNRSVIKILIPASFVLLAIGDCFFLDELQKHGFTIPNMVDLGVYFAAGSLLALFNIRPSRYFDITALCSFVLLVVFLTLNMSERIECILLPIIIINIGQKSTKYLNQTSEKIGDLSYGIYIYGFPVQQTLFYFFGFSQFPLMVYGFLISVLFAYFSWHIIESKALTFKKYAPQGMFKH
ncbi:MAG: acyltransferase family protein, partial [Clostridiales bacterium]